MPVSALVGRENKSTSSLMIPKLKNRVLSQIGVSSSSSSQGGNSVAASGTRKPGVLSELNGSNVIIQDESSLCRSGRSSSDPLNKKMPFLGQDTTTAEANQNSVASSPQKKIAEAEKTSMLETSWKAVTMEADSSSDALPKDLETITKLLEEVLGKIPDENQFEPPVHLKNESNCCKPKTEDQLGTAEKPAGASLLSQGPEQTEGSRNAETEVEPVQKTIADIVDGRALLDKPDSGSSETDFDTSGEFVDAESDFGNTTEPSPSEAFESFNTTAGTESSIPPDLESSPVSDPIILSQEKFEIDADLLKTPIGALKFSEDNSSGADTPKATDQSSPDIPIASKGSYNIDWDNFDESVIDPFKSKSGGRISDETPLVLSSNQIEESVIEKSVVETVGIAKSSVAPNAKKQDHQKKGPTTQMDGNAVKEDVNANASKDPLSDGTVNLAETAPFHIESTNSRHHDQNQKKLGEAPQEEKITAASLATNKSDLDSATNKLTTSNKAVVEAQSVVKRESSLADNKQKTNRVMNGATAGVRSQNQTTMVAPLARANNNRQMPPGEVDNGEEFKAGNANMFESPDDFEYLQNQAADLGGSGDSDLARESLYVKFDPLVTGNPKNDGQIPSDQQEDTLHQSIQTPPAVAQQNSPINSNNSMKNTPPSSSSQGKPSTPSTVVKKKTANVRSNQAAVLPRVDNQNHQASSQQMDLASDVDKLLSMSPNQVESHTLDSMLLSMVDSTVTGFKAPGNESQMDLLAHKLKLQFQAVLLTKEREWSNEMAKQKQRADKMLEDNKTLKNEAETAKHAASEMSIVVSAYEKTMEQLMNESEMLKRDRSGDYDIILRERDQAFEDLHNMDNSFADFHKRYEKLRSSTEDFKKNEEILKKSVSDYQAKLKRSEEKFIKLKEHAEDRLEKANEEIERLQRTKETDTLALRAQLKKRDLQVETLEKSLETKQKEIAELTAICDELIQKAGLQESS